MAYGVDEPLESETNRVMAFGVILLIAMAGVFPLYRWIEPATRADARTEHLDSLAASGEQLWNVNCSSCHGLNGQGGSHRPSTQNSFSRRLPMIRSRPS